MKLKNEALKCCDMALKDEFVNGDKRNTILKIRLNFFVEINRANCKMMIKMSKAETRKRGKKAITKKKKG